MSKNFHWQLVELAAFIKRHPRFFLAGLAFFLLFSVGGCRSTNKSPMDILAFILESEPDCAAPCWQSLRPGFSTENDIQKLVNTSESRMVSDVKHGELAQDGVEYIWFNKEFNIYHRVRAYEDQVKLLGFQLMNNKIPTSAIFEYYGQPDTYGASVRGSHDFYIKLSLIYEAQGVVFEASIPINEEQLESISSNCTYEIDLDEAPQRIYIYLVEPKTSVEMVQNDPIALFHSPSHQPQPWRDDFPLQLTSCP